MKLPELELFYVEGSPFPVVDPTTLPPQINRELDRFMIGRTVSHPIYIYVQDWQSFCSAVRRGLITIES